jgi:hypothetical protein
MIRRTAQYTILYYTMLCYAMLMLMLTSPPYTVLYCTVLYCAVSHSLCLPLCVGTQTKRAGSKVMSYMRLTHQTECENERKNDHRINDTQMTMMKMTTMTDQRKRLIRKAHPITRRKLGSGTRRGVTCGRRREEVGYYSLLR